MPDAVGMLRQEQMVWLNAGDRGHGRPRPARPLWKRFSDDALHRGSADGDPGCARYGGQSSGYPTPAPGRAASVHEPSIGPDRRCGSRRPHRRGAHVAASFAGFDPGSDGIGMQDKTACGFADAPAAYAKDLKDGQSLLRTIIGSFVRRHLMPLSPKDRQLRRRSSDPVRAWSRCISRRRTGEAADARRVRAN